MDNLQYLFFMQIKPPFTGSTISTLLHDQINSKDCQVLSLGDSGFLQYFKVVSSDYGKPCFSVFLFGLLLMEEIRLKS